MPLTYLPRGGGRAGRERSGGRGALCASACSSRRRFVSTLLRALQATVGVALLSGAGGCAALVPAAWLGPVPTVEGEWTGVLREVTVRDADGRRYPAAAVHVETGPRLPYDVNNDALIGGRLALLVRESGPERRVVSPAELAAAPGTAVRVAGVMVVTFVIAPPDGPGAGAKAVSRVEPYAVEPELVIRRPKVEVLKVVKPQ